MGNEYLPLAYTVQSHKFDHTPAQLNGCTLRGPLCAPVHGAAGRACRGLRRHARLLLEEWICCPPSQQSALNSIFSM